MIHPTMEIWIFEGLIMLAGNFINLQPISGYSFPGGPPVRRPFSRLKENYATWIGVGPITSHYFTSHVKCIELSQVRWNMAIRMDIKPDLHASLWRSSPFRRPAASGIHSRRVWPLEGKDSEKAATSEPTPKSVILLGSSKAGSRSNLLA